MMKHLKTCCFLGLALLLLTLPVRGAELPPEVERALPREAGQLLKDVDHWDVNSFPEGLCAIWNHLRKDVNTVLRRQTRGAVSVLLVAVLFLLGFLIGRGHTGGGDDEEYDDEPPRTPAKPLLPEERHTARVPRLVPREESSDSEPAAIPDKTPAAPMTPAAPAEEDAAAPAPFDGGMYAPKGEEIPAPFEAPRRHRRSDRRQGK